MTIFDKVEMNILRQRISDDLNRKIDLVIEHRLNAWFETNLVNRFDQVIRDEFNKIIIAKLK